jgi:putative intracellular protease/amidase
VAPTVCPVEIAIPLFDNITTLDAVGPYEVLHRIPGAHVRFVGHHPRVVRSGGGLGLTVDTSFGDLPRPDVIVVPGGPETRRLLDDRKLLDWLRVAHESSTYTTSVCTGALLLGAAGILQGLEATTHWRWTGLLADQGARPVDRRVVEQGKVITAAGVSAGLDLALVLAAKLSDDLTAQAIQLMLEYDPQPPFAAGSLDQASPEVLERARQLYDRWEARPTASS